MAVVGRGAVALRRPAGRLVASELDVEVAAARELLEVVAGDVGVQREPLGDLGRGRAVGAGADEQVDVTAGGVAEGRGHGGDGRRELVRSEVGVRHMGILPTQVVEIPRSRPMPTEAEVLDALRPVEDPEIRQSIVDLDMVRGIAVTGDRVGVTVALTVAGCPLRAEITKRVTDAVSAARRRRPRRRRPHRHDRRGARRARGAPPRRRRPRPRPRRRRRTRAPAQPVHRLQDPRARDRVGQGRGRQVVGHDEPRRSRSPSAAPGSPRSTPTCGASRCRACSASTGRRPSSTT